MPKQRAVAFPYSYDHRWCDAKPLFAAYSVVPLSRRAIWLDHTGCQVSVRLGRTTSRHSCGSRNPAIFPRFPLSRERRGRKVRNGRGGFEDQPDIIFGNCYGHRDKVFALFCRRVLHSVKKTDTKELFAVDCQSVIHISRFRISEPFGFPFRPVHWHASCFFESEASFLLGIGTVDPVHFFPHRCVFQARRIVRRRGT